MIVEEVVLVIVEVIVNGWEIVLGQKQYVSFIVGVE